MKQNLRMLEQSLETKQERLNICILNGLMTKEIHHRIRLIEFDRLSINRLMTNLAPKYTAYGDHLVYEHNDEEDED